jgi:hypothetical protein
MCSAPIRNNVFLNGRSSSPKEVIAPLRERSFGNHHSVEDASVRSLIPSQSAHPPRLSVPEALRLPIGMLRCSRMSANTKFGRALGFKVVCSGLIRIYDFHVRFNDDWRVVEFMPLLRCGSRGSCCAGRAVRLLTNDDGQGS